ncbi:hypothetical protein CEXT_338991 [Caerostris extrusa]|uniref:Uncharacterized protein n=1 Tax=Caerostris extrusa TaxID=172846 RepID=A0AAV4QV84_CAEEX|nr:hypothetical protein CEXT_338991 [Caerostris extrusa]
MPKAWREVDCDGLHFGRGAPFLAYLRYINFYLNQVITGHGSLAEYQGKFSGKNSTCDCGQKLKTESIWSISAINGLQSLTSQRSKKWT